MEPEATRTQSSEFLRSHHNRWLDQFRHMLPLLGLFYSP